jgi:hypothetical protein
MRTQFDDLEHLFPLVGFFRLPKKEPCSRCGKPFDPDYLLFDPKYGRICPGCEDVLHDLEPSGEEEDEGN